MNKDWQIEDLVGRWLCLKIDGKETEDYVENGTVLPDGSLVLTTKYSPKNGRMRDAGLVPVRHEEDLEEGHDFLLVKDGKFFSKTKAVWRPATVVSLLETEEEEEC